MLKVLAAYQAKPTLANAQKVRAYARKHPMSACLTTDLSDQLSDAIHHANRGSND